MPNYKPLYACKCPFYDREFIRGICCEGIDKAAGNTMMFSSEVEKREYIKANCIHEEPENCKLYDLLMEKYIDYAKAD